MRHDNRLWSTATVRGDRDDLVDGRERPKKPVRNSHSHSQKLKPIRIATLNIGTLTGRSRERHDGEGKNRAILEGYKLSYYGTSNSNGVAIAVDAELRSHIAEVQRHSDRLISAIIDCETYRVYVFLPMLHNVAAKTRKKGRFWTDLQDKIAAVPGDDFLLFMRRSRRPRWRGTGTAAMGTTGYGARNEDGCRILDFAEANDLVITNTFFKKRESHLVTYASGNLKKSN
ncbi:hypothetical protein OSTOST_23722, partial [Ostertagia ostertagi]